MSYYVHYNGANQLAIPPVAYQWDVPWGGTLSVMFWLRVQPDAGEGFILDDTDTFQTNGWCMEKYDSHLYANLYYAVNTAYATVMLPDKADGLWHHYVLLCREPMELSVYCDGSFVATATSDDYLGSGLDSAGALRFGFSGFLGDLDSILLIQRELTVEQIAEYYNGGQGRLVRSVDFLPDDNGWFSNFNLGTETTCEGILVTAHDFVNYPAQIINGDSSILQPGGVPFELAAAPTLPPYHRDRYEGRFRSRYYP